MCKPISPTPFHFATLVELLRYRATSQPDRVAFTFLVDGERDEIAMTYGGLDQRARAIAARLQGLGAAGERALLLYPPGLEYISAFFGCLYAGVVAVPAFPPRLNRPMPRLQGMVADGKIKVALTSTAILENIETRFTHAPDLKALHWLDSEKIEAGSELTWREPEIADDTLAFLQYTSGSTSLPKGVMLTHKNLLHNSKLIYQCFENHAGNRGVFWLPPYHDMGLIGGILQPIYGGAEAVLMTPAAFLQSPFRWLDAISRKQANVSGGPNFAYDLCVQKITPEQRATLDLSSWSLAFNGAEPVRHETLERFAETFGPCGFRKEAFYPCYGLAEATLMVTGSVKGTLPQTVTVNAAALAVNEMAVSPPEDATARTLVSSGLSPKDQQVLIVDPQTLLPCSTEAVGEVWVKGPSVSQGYWGRTEESEATFAARLADSGDGPFLRTGDLGFMHHGHLYITGRAKDLIILRGKNHYPQDIEQTVEQSHPAVRQSCVAAFAVDSDGEEKLVVVAEVERDCRHQNLDEALLAIRRAVAEHHDVPVGALMLIRTLTIPKTSSGKIQRFTCRERFLNRSFKVVAEWAQPNDESEAVPCWEIMPEAVSTSPQPRTEAEIEAWLIAQLAERLKMPAREIDPREPFASFGMDSLTALMMAGDLEQWLGRRLSPSLMYDYPSIEAVAQYLAEPASAGQPASESAEPSREPRCIVPINHFDPQMARELLARADQLSPETATALLKDMLAEEDFCNDQRLIA